MELTAEPTTYDKNAAVRRSFRSIPPTGFPVRYEFFDCSLDEVARTIVRSGTAVHIEPKVFDLLVHLLRNRNRLVPKQELNEILWPDSTVSESSLLQCVKRARLAIGDDGTRQAAIRTVHGRGYSMMAEVVCHDGPHSGVNVSRLRLPSKPEEPSSPAFIGRVQELRQFSDVLDRMVGGSGSVLTVGGDAGMGKTSLAREMGRRAAARGVEVVWVDSGSELGTPPYWAWIQAVRGFAAERSETALRAVFGPGASELVELVPSLREKLPSATAAPLPLAEQRASRLLDSLLEWLRSATRRRPLLLVLDDLQWADRSSLGVLELVTHEIASMRLLVVGCHRPNAPEWRQQFAPVHSRLSRAGRVQEMLLSGLSRSQVADWAQADLPGSASDALVDRIYRRTGGMPFFVSSILRELGSGRNAGERDRILDDAKLPASISDMVGEQLAGLDAPTRRLLQAASVFGLEFDADAAGALAELGDAALDVCVEQAEASGVLKHLGDRYAFTHALFREAVYGEISSRRVARWHHAAARAIEGRAADPTDLARHYLKARAVAEPAVVYARVLAAADYAAARYAHEDAVEFYESALAMYGKGEIESDQGADRDRAEILAKLADSYLAAGRNDRGRAAARDAAQIAWRSGEADLALRTAMSWASFFYPRFIERSSEPLRLLEAIDRRFVDLDEVRRARLCARMAFALHVEDASSSRRRELCRKAWELARDAGPQARAEVLSDLFVASLDARGMEQLQLLEQEMDALAEGSNDDVFRGRAAFGRAIIRLLRGDLAAAGTACDDLWRAAERVRLREFRLPARHLRAVIATHEGRFAEAEESIAANAREIDARGTDRAVIGLQLFALARARGQLGAFADVFESMVGDYPNLPWHFLRPLVLLRAGREQEARLAWDAAKAEGFEDLPPFTCPGMGLPLAAVLAEACAALADAPAARKLYEKLRAYSDSWAIVAFGQASFGVMSRYLGLLATAMRRWKDAEKHFRDALATYDNAGARGDLPHVQAELASMYARRPGVTNRRKSEKWRREAEERASELGIALHHGNVG